MKANIPSIPNIPANLEPSLRTLLTSIKEALEVRVGQRGDPLDRSPTVRELINGNIATLSLSGALASGGDNGNPGQGGETGSLPDDRFTNPSVPAAPTGVTVQTTTASVFIQWNPPLEHFVSHAEVWRFTANDRNQAVLRLVETGAMAVDVVEPATTHYYWVRFVSYMGVPGPFHAFNGVEATTTLTPAQWLLLLSEAITASELDQSLSDRIDLIDTPTTGLVDSLAQEILDRTNAITTVTGAASNAQATANSAVTRLNSVNGLGKSVEALAAEVETLTATSGEDGALASSAYNKAAAIETRINNVDGGSGGKTVESLAADVLTLQSTVDDGTSGVDANYTRSVATLARLNDVYGDLTNVTLEALAEMVDTIGAAVSDGEIDLGTIASDITTLQTRLGNVGGTGRSVETLGVDYNALHSSFYHASTGLAATAAAVNQAQTSITGLENDVTAQANDILQLQSEVGDNAAAIQAEAIVRANQTGELYGQYSVKIDLNGYVAGYGLSSTVSEYDNAVHSSMVFRVDTFAVGMPGAQNFTLIVDGNKVVMDGASIKDATITSAKIQSLAVDKITGDKASFIQGNFNELKSTNFNSANKVGWRMHSNGTHEIYGGPGSAIWASNLRADAVEVVDAVNLKPYAVTIWSLVQQPGALVIEPTTNPANETTIFDAYVDFTDAQPDAPLQIVCSMVVAADYPDPAIYPQSGFRGRFNLYRNGIVIWGTDLTHSPLIGTMSSLFSSAGTIPASSASAFTTWPSSYQISGRFEAGHDDIFYDTPGPGIHYYQWRFCGYVHTGSGQTFNSQFKWRVQANSRFMKFDGGKR